MVGGYVPALEHWAALRAADLRFYEERDRRYTEVALEREKAQTYRDERANQLHSQIERERSSYVTRSELLSAMGFLVGALAVVVGLLATLGG